VPSAVDALLGRLADLWRCGSAFRAEGWRALEELGVEGGGELATLGGAVPGGLWLGARFSRRRLMWPLCVALLRGLRLRAVPRSAPRAGKRLCGLDKALSARWPPSTDVETVG